MIRRSCCALILGLCLSILAAGQEPPDLNVPRTTQLTVTPAKEPVPALKYELLPTLADRKPGNAATGYYRAVVAFRMVPQDVAQQEAKWYAEHGDDVYRKVPQDDLRKWLQSYRRAIDEFRGAAYREHCDWDLRMQDLRGVATINFRIDEFQELRGVLRLVTQQARLDIAEGRLDAGLDLIRVGYQAAVDTSKGQILICGLVGVAFAEQMNERVEQIITTPESPNLYWALTALPRPLVDLRSAMEFERGLPERLFPFLKDAETIERTPEQWQRLLAETSQQIDELDSNPNRSADPSWHRQVYVMARVAQSYPRVKQELLAQGFDRERLEKLPVGQVMAIHTARSTRKSFDEMAKSFFLPHPQALQWSRQVDLRMSRERSEGGARASSEVLPVGDLLLPAVSAVIRAQARLERNLACLRTIEAIRMHAAAHGGQLPARLEQITVVPVPENPASGQAFPYRLEGDQAILDVPAALGETPAYAAKRYLIRIKS